MGCIYSCMCCLEEEEIEKPSFSFENPMYFDNSTQTERENYMLSDAIFEDPANIIETSLDDVIVINIPENSSIIDEAFGKSDKTSSDEIICSFSDNFDDSSSEDSEVEVYDKKTFNPDIYKTEDIYIEDKYLSDEDISIEEDVIFLSSDSTSLKESVVSNEIPGEYFPPPTEFNDLNSSVNTEQELIDADFDYEMISD